MIEEDLSKLDDNASIFDKCFFDYKNEIFRLFEVTQKVMNRMLCLFGISSMVLFAKYEFILIFFRRKYKKLNNKTKACAVFYNSMYIYMTILPLLSYSFILKNATLHHSCVR